jgi:ubiquinone/menaquinone biosynthesis C-methylase UbiE
MGRVIGVDMTGSMVEKARANASAVGIGNTEFHRGKADRLPAGDGSVDVVITKHVAGVCLQFRYDPHPTQPDHP